MKAGMSRRTVRVTLVAAVLVAGVALVRDYMLRPRATAASEPLIGGSASAGLWPPDAGPDGTYLVDATEAVMDAPGRRIFIPENFTLKLDPSIPYIDWKVRSIEFGRNSTFDVSRPAGPPPLTPARADPILGQPGYWQDGAAGRSGHSGLPALDGRLVRITVDSMGSTGCLWIRTDGASGGQGGPGGDGQGGGGTNCDVERTHGPNGGAAGSGGPGGQGGATAALKIVIASLDKGFSLRPVACPSPVATEALALPGRDGGPLPKPPPPGPVPPELQNPLDCTKFSLFPLVPPHTRPHSAECDNGSIIIWGWPGCGGPGGVYGSPGQPDRSQNPRHCSSFPAKNWNVWPGDEGGFGSPPSSGSRGRCSDAEIAGPE